MPARDAVGIASVIVPATFTPIMVPVAVAVVPTTVGSLAALVLIRIGKRGRGDQSDGTSKE